MGIKDAIEKLRAVADNTDLPEYSAALETAIYSMELVSEMAETLEGLHKVIQLMDNSAGVMKKQVVRMARERAYMLNDLRKETGCETCKHHTAPVPCEGEEYLCAECQHHGCICYDCVNLSKWEWRGVPDGQQGN